MRMERSKSMAALFAVGAVLLGVYPVAAEKTDVNKAATGVRAIAPPISKTDTFFGKTNLGSFKILGTGPDPAEGTVELSFDGSTLVSGLQGTVVPSGGVRLEIDRKDRNKKVFHGKGKLSIKGKFAGIQFFGRDLSIVFSGKGFIRLYGEFDKNQETGEYHFATQPEKKPWGSGGITLTNPPYRPMNQPSSGIKGQVKDVTGKG